MAKRCHRTWRGPKSPLTLNKLNKQARKRTTSRTRYSELDIYKNLNMALASLSDDKFTSVEIIRVFLAEYDRHRSRIDNKDSANETTEALQIDKKSKGIRDNKASQCRLHA